MKLLNGIAAAALALTPALTPMVAMAETAANCQANQVFVPGSDGQPGTCQDVAGGGAQGEAAAAGLPILSSVPAGAIVVGSLVILGGLVIGIVAAVDDDDSTTGTTGTTSTTSTTN